MPEIDPTRLQFREAIDFYRQKVNLPTRRWTDIWEGMHARAFVVAGATRDDLLAEFRTAIDRAISQGTGLAAFQKDFDRIVARYGWSYHGGRGWRTRVIYKTNMQTAYQAGRYAQLTDPDLLQAKPYWVYHHSDFVKEPREDHLSWNGLVLRWDDPWWSTHYPPNGWGCQCWVTAAGTRDLERMGKDGPDEAPTIETREWKNPGTGDTIDVPIGIDPGWAYNVGESAWGRPLADDVMGTWRTQGAAAWERLTPGDIYTYGRPDLIPLDKAKVSRGRRLTSEVEAAAALRKILGGEEKMFRVKVGEFTHAVNVNASSLAAHVDLNRSAFLPYLEETLTDPFEVWLAFERHKGSGQVVLRYRIIKAIDDGSGRGMLLVAQARKGQIEAWTLVPISQEGYLNKQRVGRLIWKRQ